jgi:glycosyltransferase involved in cell wall biosynthesis
MKVESASILICTYNRDTLLRETLAAMQSMRMPADCRVEIIVVDNNSTDQTESVVRESAGRGPVSVLYLREPKQGKSFALNRGLADACGDIVALTDDDVLPAADWLERIVADFREKDVNFVFGKVLPRWGCVPPQELLTPSAQDIWGPLALVDYGDVDAIYAPGKGQRLPIGANLSFARDVLVAVGGWRTDLGKVNNTLISGEDHEIFERLRRRGLYMGYYDPQLTVRHFVPAHRLTRRYFRRWFFWSGKTHALMFWDLNPSLDKSRVPHVAGVPRFAYRQALQQCWRWLRTRGSTDRVRAFTEELRLLQYGGLLTACWQRRFARRGS